MQTSTNKHRQESIVDAVSMHSGVIEGGGFVGMDQLGLHAFWCDWRGGFVGMDQLGLHAFWCDWRGAGVWAWISLGYMHSSVIEGGQMCGHGSAGGRWKNSRVHLCWRLRLESSMHTSIQFMHPGTLENTAATSPYPQRPRTASISLPPAETSRCAHIPLIVSECTSTAPAIKLCFW